MKAAAQVVVERCHGRDRCTTLRSAPPLTLRATPGGLHLVGTAAGPVGGDDLTIMVTVAAGASLVVRSVASQLVLPAPRPASSRMRQVVDVGAAASLDWRPEPMVVVRGADHRVATVVTLAADADLVWRDEVVLGRDGEVGGSLLQRIRIERAGVVVLCTEVALGPAWPTSAGPAGIGGARVVASTVLVGRPARDTLDGAEATAGTSARAALFRLAGDAVLLTALGDELDSTRAALAAWPIPATPPPPFP